MRIEFQGSYKCVSAFLLEDLPKFVILTGPNGTGKTQLLELLHASIKNENDFPEITVSEPPFSSTDVVLIRDNWIITNIGEITFETIQDEIRNLRKQFNQYKTGDLRDAKPRLRLLFDHVISRTGKDMSKISDDEFVDFLPRNIILDENQIFNQNINKIFYNYHIDTIEAQMNGQTFDEFVETRGRPPWDILNDTIKTANLPYTINKPKENSIKSSFHMRIFHNQLEEYINFQDLSSGEKVLFSLVFWLFQKEDLEFFPKLLLLDEPDCHLHPSMTKQFLDVVHDVLVEKYGLHVVMTTHSPSTVALAPEGTVFEMSLGQPRIQLSKSRNKTISSLTSGLVTVGKGTRFVIVEAEDDVDFYNEITKHFVQIDAINPDIPLVYIPASNPAMRNRKTGGGGSKEVSKWVPRLQKSGLGDIIQGIVDRDQANKSESGIHLLGRYSIENYIADPVVVYGLLIDHEKAPEILSVVIPYGHEQNLTMISNEDAQNIVNYFVREIESLNSFPSSANKSKVEERFFGERILEYPRWYKDLPGKEIFKFYRVIYGGSLINAKNVFNMFRKLHILPEELGELIRYIQEFSLQND